MSVLIQDYQRQEGVEAPQSGDTAARLPLGPATLWGILTSDCREEFAGFEAEIDSLSVITEDSSVQEEAQTLRSRETVAGLPPGPAILWGILLSEGISFRDCEVLDVNTTINLWLAAGYLCPLLMEDAPSLVDDDTIPKDPASRHQSQEVLEPIGPYIVKASPGKGQGVFAARDLLKGERILVDRPFFAVTKPYNYHKVLRAFENLSFSNRRLYMQLSCPDRSDDIQLSDVMRIFEANCFNIGERAAIFLKATRFNHSCLPNTYYSWSETRAEIVFHSMVPIPKGEEMTICYGKSFLTRLERRSELRIYNFHCHCPACRPDTAFGQASESRRLAMRGLEEQIALLSHQSRDPLTAILRLIELVKEEGLQGDLMTPYRDAADWLKQRGNLGEALAFVRLEMEEEVVCLGVDSEVVARTGEYIEELQTMLIEQEKEDIRPFGLGGNAASRAFELRVEDIEPDSETRGLEETEQTSEEQKSDNQGDAGLCEATTTIISRQADYQKTQEEPAELYPVLRHLPSQGINELVPSAMPALHSSFDNDDQIDFNESDPTISSHPFSSQ